MRWNGSHARPFEASLLKNLPRIITSFLPKNPLRSDNTFELYRPLGFEATSKAAALKGQEEVRQTH